MKQQRMLIVILLSLALAAPVCAAQAATDLVKNGDFENAMTDWSFSGPVVTVTASPISGNTSVQLGYYGKIFQDTLPATPGPHRLRFRAKLNDFQPAMLEVRVSEGGGANTAVYGPYSLSTTATDLDQDFIIPIAYPGAVNITFENKDNGHVMVDDVRLIPETGITPTITPTPNGSITPTPIINPVGSDLVVNGDFENYLQDWSISGPVLIASASAIDGTVSVQLGYYGKIYQNTLPAIPGYHRLKFKALLRDTMPGRLDVRVIENGGVNSRNYGPYDLITFNQLEERDILIFIAVAGPVYIHLENKSNGLLIVDEVHLIPESGGTGGSTPTPAPTLSPTITPTPSISPTPTVTETPTITPTGTAGPTGTPTLTPTVTPTPIAAELSVTANPSRLRVNGLQAGVAPRDPVPGAYSTIRMFLFSQSGQSHTLAQANNFTVTLVRGPGLIAGPVTDVNNGQMFEVQYQATLESGVSLIEVEYDDGTTQLKGSTTVEVIATDVYAGVGPGTGGTGAQSPEPVARRLRYQRDLAN